MAKCPICRLKIENKNETIKMGFLGELHHGYCVGKLLFPNLEEIIRRIVKEEIKKVR